MPAGEGLNRRRRHNPCSLVSETAQKAVSPKIESSITTSRKQYHQKYSVVKEKIPLNTPKCSVRLACGACTVSHPILTLHMSVSHSVSSLP